MRASEAGYATLAVTSLMVGLSLVAIAFNNLSLAHAKRLAATSEQLQTDVRLDGAFYELVAKLVDARSSPSDLNAWKHFKYSGAAFRSRIQSEAAKIDINRAPLEHMKSQMTALGLTEEAGILLAERLKATNLAFPSFDHIEGMLSELDGGVCLRDQLTIFDSLPAFRSSANRPQKVQDGSVIRVQLQTYDDNNVRGLEVHFRITGRRDEPIWILGWRRYSGDQEGICDAKI